MRSTRDVGTTYSDKGTPLKTFEQPAQNPGPLRLDLRLSFSLYFFNLLLNCNLIKI